MAFFVHGRILKKNLCGYGNMINETLSHINHPYHILSMYTRYEFCSGIWRLKLKAER